MSEKLEKSEWRVFLEQLSKDLIGKRAEIEVASLRLGDQIEAERVPLPQVRPQERRRRSDPGRL